MTTPAFAQALMRKSERALLTARVGLREGDTDTAVNRAYYAMFNAARAALLSAGIPEDELPKTHRGLISAFGQQTVKFRHLDADLGRSLNKAESLRLTADYTGVQIDSPTAERAVERAETFVRTVERAFNLGTADLESAGPERESLETASRSNVKSGEANAPQQQPFTIEEQQRQASENGLRFRQQQAETTKSSASDRTHKPQSPTLEPEQGYGRGDAADDD